MKTPYDYADLDWEAGRLIERGAERVAEYDAERGTAYRDSHLHNHVYRAHDALREMEDAVQADEYDAAQTKAADALNHLLMALRNVDGEGGSDD